MSIYLVACLRFFFRISRICNLLNRWQTRKLCVCLCVCYLKKKIILRHIFLHSFNSKWREEILTYLIHSLTYFTPCLSIFFSLNRNRCDKKISLAKLNKFLCWPVYVDETWEVWDEINRHCPQNKKIKIQKI